MISKMIPEFVHTEVVVREAHTNRTWHAALPNGKIVVAFLEEGAPPAEFSVGTRLRVRMSVTDFSRAEIAEPVPAE